jgi:hypothetical protein
MNHHTTGKTKPLGQFLRLRLKLERPVGDLRNRTESGRAVRRQQHTLNQPAAAGTKRLDRETPWAATEEHKRTPAAGKIGSGDWNTVRAGSQTNSDREIPNGLVSG